MTTTSSAPAAARLRRAVATQFGDFPATVWTLFAGTVINRLGYLVTPFLVFYLGAQGIAADRVPYVLGALGVGNLVGPAAGGLLADRLGRRTTMLISMLGNAASLGLLYVAPGMATLALAAALVSMFGSMWSPAAFSMLTDVVAPGRRSAVFALSSWAVNIGTGISSAGGGFLAAHGYWLLFAIDAGTNVACAVIVALGLPAGRPQAATATVASHGYGVVLRDRLLLAVLSMLGVQLLIYSLSEVALPLAVHADHLSPTVFGLMAVINAGLVVTLQPTATRYLTRLPQMPVFAGSNILIAVGIALTGVAHHAYAFAFTVVVWSIGEVCVIGIPGSIVADLAPADARGRYQGAFTWAWGVARFTALTLGAWTFTVNPAALWWSSAVLGFLSTAGMLALAPAINHRTVTSQTGATPVILHAAAAVARPENERPVCQVAAS